MNYNIASPKKAKATMSVLKYFTKEKIKNAIKTVLGFILNPRLLLCFGIAWMITNGWAYVVFGLGLFFDIVWMQAVGAAYVGLLWLPVTPEKIITVGISIFLLRILFPKDEKTLGVLIDIKNKAVNAVRKRHKKDGQAEDTK